MLSETFDTCHFCKEKEAKYHCGGQCGVAMYCSQECASNDFNHGNHSKEKCSELVKAIIFDPSRPEFESRGFYEASVKKMQSLYKKDIFGWFALQIFMHSPFINQILFPLKGDLTKLDNKFGGVAKKHARIPDKGYDKFMTFFYSMLETWQFKHRNARLGAAKGNFVRNQQELLQAYPKLVPFFQMSNAHFTYEFIMRIQRAILSIPKSKKDTIVWRGYSVLNIPGTLTVDIDALRIGEEIATWGFMSVAIDSKISVDFLKPSPMPSKPTCCMLRVLIPGNSRHSMFLISGTRDDNKYNSSAFVTHGQTEILLPIGTVVRVMKKYGSLTMVGSAGQNVVTKVADVMVVGYKKLKTRPIPK